MKLFALLLIVLLVSCANESKNVQESGLEKSDVNIDVHKFKLDNGLTVLLHKDSKLPIFSYYTFYKVGSIHEVKGITGASHFLEHMMFKGAKNFGKGRFDYIIEGNGGRSNAYTTADATVYYEHLPSQSLDLIIKVEADRLQNLLLEEAAFEKERGVVLEERKMRYENSAGGKLYLTMMENIFEGTPYGRSVIGDIPDLKSVTRDQMMAYFKKMYAPNNAIVVIVGDMDIEQTKENIIAAYKDIPKSVKVEEYKSSFERPENFQFKGKFNRWVKVNGQTPLPKFMLGFKGVKIGTRRGFVLDILSSILGDGKSSHLNQVFVEKRNATLSDVSVGNYTLNHSGVFYVSGSLKKSSHKSLRRLKSKLYKELANSCNEKVISKRNVQKIKNLYLTSLYGGLRTNSGIAGFIGNREKDYGDYNFYKKELLIYDSITQQELIDECKNTIKKKDSIFLSVWEKHK